MALQPLQAQNPLGMFDGLDSEYLTLLGGEVVTFKSVALTSSDLDTYDAKDGYSGTPSVRPAITKTLVSGNRPLWLADEGIAGYGTLYGSIIGGVAGQVVGSLDGAGHYSGTVIGPSTAAGSGKVTCWDKPGLYKISLDAVDVTANTGLLPSNTSLVPGAALYATTAGKLTPNVSAAFEAVTLGRFIEFSTNGSLVTTPPTLVATLNSPSGPVQTQVNRSFIYATIHFAGHLD